MYIASLKINIIHHRTETYFGVSIGLSKVCYHEARIYRTNFSDWGEEVETLILKRTFL
jgi:hypothetical protein